MTIKERLDSIRHRVRLFWNVWFFVFAFSLALILIPIGWLVMMSLPPFDVPWLQTPMAIFFLFGFFIVFISLILAIGENSPFIGSFILLFLGVALGVAGYHFTIGSTTLFDATKLAEDFYANVSTEFVSIAITVLAIQGARGRLHWRDYQRGLAAQDNEPKPEDEDIQVRLETEQMSDIATSNRPSELAVAASAGAVLTVAAFIIGYLFADRRS